MVSYNSYFENVQELQQTIDTIRSSISELKDRLAVEIKKKADLHTKVVNESGMLRSIVWDAVFDIDSSIPALKTNSIAQIDEIRVLAGFHSGELVLGAGANLRLQQDGTIVVLFRDMDACVEFCLKGIWIKSFSTPRLECDTPCPNLIGIIDNMTRLANLYVTNR